MHGRPLVFAAAFACLALLAIGPLEGRARSAPDLLAGTIVHADARSPVAARPPAVEPRAPVCASANPHGASALVAVIAHPHGSAPRMTADVYRGLVAAANGLVFQQAEESGAPGADLVFACDAAGSVRVDDVNLPTTLVRTT